MNFSFILYVCRTNGLRESNEVVLPYPNNNLDQPYANKLRFLRFPVCDPQSDKNEERRGSTKKSSKEKQRRDRARFKCERAKRDSKLSPASSHKSKKSDFSGRVPPSFLELI